MRREEKALVNHHTKKDEEDSVNCVEQCTVIGHGIVAGNISC
jgi:hypothetical protein